MSEVIIWNIATRALHLAFAGGLSAALLIGFTVDDESPLFQLHMLAGLFAGGALAVRLALGFFGGRHTRFADWTFGPVALFRYLRGLLPGRREANYAGHNPAASWVMAGMFATAAALIWTGLDGGEDIHEGLAVAMIVLIGGHLAGLALHTALKKENIALAMAHGRKKAAPEAGLAGHGWIGGALVVATLGVWGFLLWSGHDFARGELRLPGLRSPLILSEGGEDAGSSAHAGEHRGHAEDHD